MEKRNSQWIEEQYLNINGLITLPCALKKDEDKEKPGYKVCSTETDKGISYTAPYQSLDGLYFQGESYP